MEEMIRVLETAEREETVSKNFTERKVERDLAGGIYDHVQTRLPPEPNGYLYVGHTKSILLDYDLTRKCSGKFDMRFDDTNPTKEKVEFVGPILVDVK